MLVLISMTVPLRTVFRHSSTVVMANEREEIYVVFNKGSKILAFIVTVNVAPRSAKIGGLKVKVRLVGLWVIQEG
jgi:hypothetical protein